MLRSVFFYITFLYSTFLFSQKKGFVESFDVGYRQKFYSNNFYQKLNNINSINLFNNVHEVVIGHTGHGSITRKYASTMSIFYAHILPVQVKVNDSIDCKFTGYTFGISAPCIDPLFFKYKNFDLLIGAGGNVGRVKLYGNESIRAKNMFFAPKLLLMPRVGLGPIAIGLTIEYDYDITFDRWRKIIVRKRPSENINRFRQSGLSYILSIGIRINNNYRLGGEIERK